MIILRPKYVIFERFWPFTKFHFPACSTLYITLGLCKLEKEILKEAKNAQKLHILV